jgi:hypothetical protein
MNIIVKSAILMCSLGQNTVANAIDVHLDLIITVGSLIIALVIKIMNISLSL